MKRPLSAHNRRARAALLWTAGLFLAAQLVGGFLLDTVGQAIRFPSAAHVLERVEQGERPAVICLGSSRFAHGLNESLLKEGLTRELGGAGPAILNASVPAGDQVSSDYILQKLLAEGVRPRLALVEVTPESLNACNTWLNVHVQRQLGWEDLPRFGREIFQANQLLRLVKARLLPLYLHRRQLLRESWEAVRPESETPAEKIPDAAVAEIVRNLRKEPPRSQAAAIQHGASQVPRWLRNYSVGGTSAAALERVLRRCAEHGVTVVLVAPPVTAAHRAAYTPPIDAAFSAYVTQLAPRHGCRLVSHRDRLPDELFIDNHHLSTAGGRTWSEIVAAEVLAPAWRRMDGP